MDNPLTLATRLKRLPWFEIVIVIALLGINSYAAFSDAYNLPNKWFTRDDAYYYFKVAQNVSEGHGSTFDGINPTNGYHPLWMLACVPIFALARFDLVLPLRILILVLAGLRAATSILLYHLLRDVVARSIAILAALYWAFDYYIFGTAYQQGLETGLAAFCLVLFLYLLRRFERDRKMVPHTSGKMPVKQIAILAVAATLVMFSRLDLVFLAVLFGLWIVFRDRPLAYLLPLDILSAGISVPLAFIIRTGLPAYYEYANLAVVMLVISLVLKIPLFYFLGLYRHPKSYSFIQLIKQSALAIGIATLATLVILLGLTSSGLFDGSFPRTAPLIDGVLSFVLVIAIRLAIAGFSPKKEVFSISPLEDFKANWHTWLGEGALFYGILGGSLGIYMLWNKIAFGTTSPVSGEIKRWWGSFADRIYGGSARTLTAFFGIEPGGDLNAWHPITTLVGNWNEKFHWLNVLPMRFDPRYAFLLVLSLVVLVLLLLINRKRAARITHQLALIPLLAGAVLQIVQYNITGYAALKEWYWVSQMVFITLAGSMLLDILSQPLRRLPITHIAMYLVIFYYGINSALWFEHIVVIQMPYGAKPADTPYMDIVTFVEDHTEPGSLIGMTGGGNVGYFVKDRTIVNMDGLINSYAYFQANKARLGSDYLYDMGLEYIFANPDFLEYQPYRGQYTDRLDIIDYFGGKAIMHFLPAP